MLKMPAGALSAVARANLERFRATAAARELEDDPQTWSVVEWSWTAGPPMRICLRNPEGAAVDFIEDETGVWRLWREPIGPKVHTPTDIARPL